MCIYAIHMVPADPDGHEHFNIKSKGYGIFVVGILFAFFISRMWGNPDLMYFSHIRSSLHEIYNPPLTHKVQEDIRSKM